MEYITEKDGISFIIDEKIYNISVITKSAYMFIDEWYIFLEYISDNKIKVTMTFKGGNNADIYLVAKEFGNELLTQKIRYDIANETKNIREIILGRALYSTCLEMNDNNVEQEDSETTAFIGIENQNLEEIAVNWFSDENGT